MQKMYRVAHRAVRLSVPRPAPRAPQIAALACGWPESEAAKAHTRALFQLAVGSPQKRQEFITSRKELRALIAEQPPQETARVRYGVSDFARVKASSVNYRLGEWMYRFARAVDSRTGTTSLIEFLRADGRITRAIHEDPHAVLRDLRAEYLKALRQRAQQRSTNKS